MERPSIQVALSARPSTRLAEVSRSFESSWLRGVLNWLVITKIAGLVLVFDPYSLQAFDLPKSLFSRATEWLIAGVIVCALLRYGFEIVPRAWLHVPIVAFVVTNVLSTIVAENSYVALFGEWERYEGLTFVIDMALLYLAVAIAFRPSDGWAYGVSLALVTVVTLAYALVQYLRLDPIPWTGGFDRRPFSTFGHPNFFGEYLSLVGGALIAIVGAPRHFASVSPRVAAGVLFAAVVVIASVVATRGTLLAIGAALLTALVVTAARGKTRRNPLPAFVFGLGGLLVLIASVWFFTPLGERMQVSGLDGPSRTRLFSYDTAVRALLDRPLVGYGPDNLRSIYPRYRQPERAEFAGAASSESSVHNWILQTGVSTGLLGVISLGATLVLAGARLFTRMRRDPDQLTLVLLTTAVAYWVHALVAPASVSVDWAPWLILGALVATDPRIVAVEKKSMKRGALAAIALIALALGSVTPFVALQASRRAASALVVERNDEASVLAAAAVSLDPGRAQYWAVLGRAFASKGSWGEAAASYEEAARKAPYEWSRWADLGGALASGRRNAEELRHAVEVAARAVAVDPYEPAAHAALARIALTAGANDLALRSAAIASRLFSRGGYERLVFTAALSPQAHPNDAQPLIRSALEKGENPYLHLALAAVEFQAGHIEAGRTEVQLARAQGATPSDVDRVLRELGK